MFKNLMLYKFTEPFTLTNEGLKESIEKALFHPCGSNEGFSQGFTEVITDKLVCTSREFMMICFKREDKLLPAAVVNEMLQVKIKDIEDKKDRILSKKERVILKENLVFELLPRAFSTSKKTLAYIDTKGGWMVVDAASAMKAEDLLSHLRKCLGSLPIAPIHTVNKPSDVMTGWLIDSTTIPAGLTIEDECELHAIENEGVVRCKHHDLSSSEVKNHLDSGRVNKLYLSWHDKFSFIVDENLAIKRLKFLGLIQDEIADTEAETEEERFNADFSITALEIADFLPRFIEMFGGEPSPF